VSAGARIGWFDFSPDGRRFMFTNTRDDRVELYLGDVATVTVRRVDGALNALTAGCGWREDSSALLCGFVPESRGPLPAASRVPAGPNVQEHAGPVGPVRTLQDALKSDYDERLFEYYFATQLAIVDAASGQRIPIGQPGLITWAEMSPDGKYLFVERIKRPFSRQLVWFNFPKDVEVWTRAGQTVRRVADVPMGDTVPALGVRKGPRAYRWHPLEPSTLVWVEALDEGDIRNNVPFRDRIMAHHAPFSATPTEVVKTEYRFATVNWAEGGAILLSEADRATRTTRTWLLDANWQQARKVWDRRQQDAYSNPGAPMWTPGRSTLRQSGDFIYLTGPGASPEGDRPFLDRLSLATLATERLFRSDVTGYESVVTLLDNDATRVLTRFETRTQPPNYFVRDLRTGVKHALTDFKDPHPQITAAERTLVSYNRKDGVQLSGTMHVPAGRKPGELLPLLVWAYPVEFADPDSASQIVGSPNRFRAFGLGPAPFLLLTQGYAIFEPTMPIVGPGETANDTYIEQLVASAEAAVEKAVAMGIADRHRIGVAGHSYGAFMTANLLAHSDLFAAGVARSGAYNRSLTPFGFQRETRTFWEIPRIYERVSPFWYANQINEPILLIHGEADNNAGTFPMQSERMFLALKGNGATVRYVTLPHEAHAYTARESVLHTVAETVNWLDTYVKNAVPKPAGAAEPSRP
jgi:dipeptidyl aminopeptidase/acylaminoacyl peptidase